MLLIWPSVAAASAETRSHYAGDDEDVSPDSPSEILLRKRKSLRLLPTGPTA